MTHQYLNEYFDNEHVDGTFFNPLRNHARHLSNRLMEIELGVHEKLLDIIGTCESSISELYAKHADKHRELYLPPHAFRDSSVQCYLNTCTQELSLLSPVVQPDTLFFSFFLLCFAWMFIRSFSICVYVLCVFRAV